MEGANDREKRPVAGGMCGRAAGRCPGMNWCGVFFVLAGLLWLAARTGWLAPELFWPVLLVFMGTLMILPHLWKRAGRGEERTSRP